MEFEEKNVYVNFKIGVWKQKPMKYSTATQMNHTNELYTN